MCINRRTIEELSSKYDVPTIDSLMIALNTFGARSHLPYIRIRSYFSPNGYSKRFYLMICLNSSPSPFELDESRVLMNGEEIGKLEKLENDIAELCYFRKKNRVLVLNTNNRARCIGNCKFCGAKLLTPRENRKILVYGDLKEWFKKIESFAKVKFSNLEEICLNTGLFRSEEEVVNHLISIYNAANLLGFNGEIKYIGAEIRSDEALKKISKHIPKFSYYFTLETFEHRDYVDRKKDFLPFYINTVVEFLENLKNYGFETSVLYILGLDSLESLLFSFERLKNSLTRFPVINVFQAYHPSFEQVRHPEARSLEYFLKARTILEKIFEDSNLKPKLWENYRSLWYTTYRGEKLGGQELQTFVRGY